jgi:hypothetical protein
VAAQLVASQEGLSSVSKGENTVFDKMAAAMQDVEG